MTDLYDDPHKKQADAMAAAQAWGLVAHACAIHHGHPHAAEMMADDIAALEQSRGIALVVVALGDGLGDTIGHRCAIGELTVRIPRPTERVKTARMLVETVADSVAAAIAYDGNLAMHRQRECGAEAEWWGIVADCLKQLADELDPPHD